MIKGCLFNRSESAGGGDYISNDLVSLYWLWLSETDDFSRFRRVQSGSSPSCSLCWNILLSAYTKRLLPYFNIPWQIGWLDGNERRESWQYLLPTMIGMVLLYIVRIKNCFVMKTILIFGATGTLGAYISLHFHGLGYKVIAVGHRKSDNGFLQITIFLIIPWIFQTRKTLKSYHQKILILSLILQGLCLLLWRV